MKELRITAVLQVPDSALEQAKTIAALEPHIDALSKAMGVEVETRIVNPTARKPKAAQAPAAPEPIDAEVLPARRSTRPPDA